MKIKILTFIVESLGKVSDVLIYLTHRSIRLTEYYSAKRARLLWTTYNK